MKLGWSLCVILAAPLLAAAPSGWIDLFDGKTMAGWEDPRQKVPPGDAWTIADGCLKSSARPHITEDLFTRELFHDFELAFEWRVAAGANSGVKYRIQDRVFLAHHPVPKFEDLVNFSIGVPAEAGVQVQPVLNHFKPFPLRPQRTLHSAGSIPAHLGGSGTDFWGVREYRPGDSLRRLDWRLTARHPHQFFTKEFEQEEIADIGLILDARYKTNLKQGDESLFEHSARAAASLAEVFLQQGNRLSMLIYGQDEVTLYPGYGKVQLYRILNALARVKIEPGDKLDNLQLAPLHIFSKKSLILVLSPLAANDWQLFPRLRAHGFQVLLISPDPLDYAASALPADPLGRIAARLTQLERRLEIEHIAQLWIPVIDWQVSQPLAPLVRNALLHTHVQQQR